MGKFDLLSVINQVDKKEVIELLEKLVMIPSHIYSINREEEISKFVYGIFQKESIDTILQEVEPKRYNIIATLNGCKKEKTKSLALNGHLDTVPPNDSMLDIKPITKDGKIFGLGTTDMKSGVAAMMYAMILLKRLNIKLDGDLYFTGVVGEESGGTGTSFLVESGFKADYFIIGEPTGLEIVNTHKGCFQMDIVIEGKAAHASMPERGTNAIEAMAEFICLLKKEYVPKLKQRKQSRLGSPTINLGIINGGKKINVVADKCFLKIDRRWIDKEKNIDFIAEIKPYLKKVCDKNPNLKFKISSALPANRYFGPFYLDENSVFSRICKKALRNIGLKPKFNVLHGWTDGATILNKGYPTLIIGPGNVEVAHTAGEFVKVDQLETAVKIYLSLIYEICVDNK